MTKATLALAAVCILSAEAPAAERYMMYRSFKKELAETRAFADMGVGMRAFGICNTHNIMGLPYSDYPMVWLGPDKYDFSVVDRMFEDLLKASPDETFCCLLDLNSPSWLSRQLRMDSFNVISHAASDPRWLDATRRYLCALVDHVEGKWGDRVRAYLLMAGATTEWFEIGVSMTSDVKDAAFARWCEKKGYKGLPPRMPSQSEYDSAAFEGVMYDPAKEGWKIAARRFHNEVIADALLDFAAAARSKFRTKKELGAFFGYYLSCNRDFPQSGHLDYERVYQSGLIDFVSSPATYSDRDCGFGTGSMAVSGTLRRYGRRLLHEIDFWPDYSKPVWLFEHYWKTPQETLAGNTREAAFALVNGASLWWFDMLGNMYRNDDLRRRISDFAGIFSDLSADDRAPVADVLLVADPDSAYSFVGPAAECPDGFQPSLGCGDSLRNAVYRLGVSYDTCSFNDLSALDLSRVRLVMLPASWTLTTGKKALLEKYVMKPGRTILWTYAPGVSDGRTLDVRRVEAFAGVPFKTRTIATTEMPGGWKSVYAYDWQQLDEDAMRSILDAAGCHRFVDGIASVSYNGRLLAIHVGTGGVRTVRLPRPATEVKELFSGRTIPVSGNSFADDFAEPDTKLYEIR